MNTADTTENTEKKTSALPAKKVSDSELNCYLFFHVTHRL